MTRNTCILLWTLGVLGQLIFMLDSGALVMAHATTSLEADDVILFITNSSGIYKSFGNGSDIVKLPVNDVGSPYAIDVDVAARLIFWTDISSRKIKRVDLDGGEAITIAATGTSPKGIAIDREQEQIFWTDTSTDSVETVKYNGTGRRRVFYSANVDPWYIDVNEHNRKIYWTNTGSDRRYDSSYRRTRTTYYRQIISAGYLGQDQRHLTPTSSNQPFGIALSNDSMFWCEGSHSIRSASQAGAGTRTISRGTCGGVAFHQGKVYWTDISRDAIGVWDSTTLRATFLYSGEITNPIDLYVGSVPRPNADNWECTFDKSRCGWKQSAEDHFDWKRVSGEVATESDGPDIDHTQGNNRGGFMFATTTNISLVAGNVATLISPLVNASGSPPKCFRFWYYMGNARHSSLKVYFHPDEDKGHPKLLWSKYGVQLGQWMGAEVQLGVSGTGHVLLQFNVGDDTSSSIAIDAVHVGPCREATMLTCGDDTMLLYLDKAKLGIFDADSVTLRSASCSGYDNDTETVAIKIPYDSCGTLPYESSESIVFSNVATVEAQPGLRSSSVEFRVNCSLPRRYRVDMAFLAHSWVKYVTDNGVGNFTIGIQQYPNEKIEGAYPSSSYPLAVDVGDTIYMATEISMKNLVQSHNSRCWATSSPDPMGYQRRDIIIDGCPVDANVRVISSNKPNLRPFAFKAFAFDEPDMHLIYVHCDVIVCRQTEDSTSACNPNCTSSYRAKRNSRHARDVRSGPHTVSQGPFISGQLTSKFGGGQFNLNSMLLIVASVCLVAMAAAVGYSRKRSE